MANTTTTANALEVAKAALNVAAGSYVLALQDKSLERAYYVALAACNAARTANQKAKGTE